MKRTALLLLFAALLVVPATAFAADEFLLGFTGFDYETDNVGGPDPTPGVYLQIGDNYEVVGFVTSFGPLLDPWTDFALEEYTIHMTGLEVQTRNFFAGFLACTFKPNGRVRYYSDLIALLGGTPGVYGTNPRNATAPSTFTDGDGTGTLQLGGAINNFIFTYDFNTNLGNWEGDVCLDEGFYLTYIDPSQYCGWILGAPIGPPNPTIPTGYDNQIQGECRIPDITPTTHSSWGAVKALYR
jgi:hypothetical protein